MIIQEYENCHPTQTAKMRTRYWRQHLGPSHIQNSVKLSIQQMKNDGMYDNIVETPINELPKPLFVFKVIEMMTSCGMKLLADELISYVGFGDKSTLLRVDSCYSSHPSFNEYNWGCVLLKKLNASLFNDVFREDTALNIQCLRGRYVSQTELGMLFLRGRYMSDEFGKSIIKKSNALRRCPRIVGPKNCGNVLVEGEEILYEESEYDYYYGMYGSKDCGVYMLERDDQDAVQEFPVS